LSDTVVVKLAKSSTTSLPAEAIGKSTKYRITSDVIIAPTAIAPKLKADG